MTLTATLTPTARTARLVEGIRAPFLTFVSDFAALTTSRADIAPKFYKAFLAWQGDTHQTFVQFVRDLDPSIGSARADYRKHKTFQAADYLRRLAIRAAKPAVKKGEAAPAPASALDGMARLLASVLPMIHRDQLPKLWEAVSTELHWSPRKMTHLQHLVAQVDPLASVRPQRGTTPPQLLVAPARHAHAAEARVAA